MPVVLTDHTNKVWCMEQPDDSCLHAGFIGKGGPRIEDLLEFVESREKQFKAFLAKKAKGITDGETRNSNVLRGPKSRRPDSAEKQRSEPGSKSETRGSGSGLPGAGRKSPHSKD